MFCLLILSIGCKLWWDIIIHEQEGYQIGGKLQSNFCPMLLPWSSMLSLLSICSNCLVQHMLSPLYARRIAMSVLYASDVRTRAQASPLLYRALLLWKHKGTRNTFFFFFSFFFTGILLDVNIFVVKNDAESWLSMCLSCVVGACIRTSGVTSRQCNHFRVRALYEQHASTTPHKGTPVRQVRPVRARCFKFFSSRSLWFHSNVR